MAETLVQEGSNLFVFAKVGTAWQMMGTANTITEDETLSEVTVNCDQDGTTPLTFGGVHSQKLTIGGVYFIHDTTEEGTYFSLIDARAAKRAKTKLEFFIGAASTTGTKGQTYAGSLITNINAGHKNGDASTWNIQITADSVADTTLA